MAIELQGAAESVVGPVRESIGAAKKTQAVTFPDAEESPVNDIPISATRAGKILGFDSNGDLTLFDPINVTPA